LDRRSWCIYTYPPEPAPKKTLELLQIGCRERYPWQKTDSDSDTSIRTNAKVEITQDIREWDYGDYEGITSHEIRERRKKEGKGHWDIWTDGCPGGESPEDVTARVDRLISEIRSEYHAPVIGKCTNEPSDVLVVAHGHILRAFAMRWAGKTLHDGPTLLLEAGGIGTLSYEHYNLEEPAILLGGSFMVDVVEKAAAGEGKC